MASLNGLIDVVTIGSERPLRRLLAYYVIIGLIVALLAWAFPRTAILVAGKGLKEVAAIQRHICLQNELPNSRRYSASI